MQRIVKGFVPFGLTFLIGIVAGQFSIFNVTRRHRCDDPPVIKVARVEVTPIQILSVPDANFPEPIKRKQDFFRGSVRLRALFDRDGTVKNIRTSSMLPFDVPKSEAGKGIYSDFESTMKGGRVVRKLPYDLTSLALHQLGNTKFVPRRINGGLADEWITADVQFCYSESLSAVGCSRIDVTLMNDEGIVWRGNMWTNRSRSCFTF